MPKPIGQPRVTTSVTISYDFFMLCKKHNIGFSEATRKGISIMLAEKDVIDYDDRIELVIKMNKFRKLYEELKAEAGQ